MPFASAATAAAYSIQIRYQHAAIACSERTELVRSAYLEMFNKLPQPHSFPHPAKIPFDAIEKGNRRLGVIGPVEVPC